MKILVTGSTGLVGSKVVKDLVEQGDTVYSTFHDSKPEHGIPTHMDLLHPYEIENILEKAYEKNGKAVQKSIVDSLANNSEVDLESW